MVTQVGREIHANFIRQIKQNFAGHGIESDCFGRNVALSGNWWEYAQQIAGEKTSNVSGVQFFSH